MTIVGIGCDLLSLGRLRGVIARRGADRLAARILSKMEAHEWHMATVTNPTWSSDRTERFLGTRWAAKEAAYKALYPRVQATWKDLSLVRGASGLKPELVWEGDRAQGQGITMHCSLSHDADLVMAYVIVEHDGRTSGAGADDGERPGPPASTPEDRPNDDDILARLTKPRYQRTS